MDIYLKFSISLLKTWEKKEKTRNLVEEILRRSLNTNFSNNKKMHLAERVKFDRAGPKLSVAQKPECEEKI